MSAVATLARGLAFEATGEGLIVMDVYARKSSREDEQGREVTYSVEAQAEWGIREVEENPAWVLGKVHKDAAKSAWRPGVVRPEFQALMKRLRSGEAGGVWFRNVDRFTRKMREAVDLVEVAQKGCVVASTDGTFDLTATEDQERFYERALEAEKESNRTSRRTRNGKRNKVKQRGQSNASWRGFARPGYLMGLNEMGLKVPVPAEQLAAEVAAVREAADRLIAGGTFASIVADWNDAGLTTVTGARWDSTRIRDVLRAPSIAGFATFTELTGEVKERALPGEPVLDRDTWTRVNHLLDTRKRGRPATQYLLSGFMTCGHCGAPIYGRPLVSKPPYEDGSVKRSYWCQPRAKEQRGCGRVAMDQRVADDAVKLLVVERLGDPAHADRVRRTRTKMGAKRALIEAELDRLNGEVDDLIGKQGTGLWTPARVESKLAEYEGWITEATERLNAVDMPDDAGAATADALGDWERADDATKREMVRRAFPEGLTLLPATSTGRKTRTEVRIKAGRIVLEAA
jgi:site-specific DNA recombinase